MSAPAQLLGELELPVAPPVVRARAVPLRGRRGPAVALVALGIVLVLAPIVGGLFSKVAAGKQMLDAFEPHLEADALARYETDLGLLRDGKAALDAVYAQGGVAGGRFPGIDRYRQDGSEVDARATGLLRRIEAAEPDYRRVARIGGFDRIPFLIVLSGVVALYGGCLLLGRRPDRARAGAALVVLAAAALAAYPFLGHVPSGAEAGGRMLDALAPVMTPQQVRLLQDDFVLLVQAVGELDTGFRQVPQPGPPGAAVAALVDAWPRVSSDLAGLVGTINDDLGDYRALRSLDRLPGPPGAAGLAGLPWLLVALGALSAGLAVAAVPHRPKETS